MSHAAYHARRKAAALPMWRAVAEAREAGKKLREIAEEMGINTAAAVHRMEQKFHAHRLSQRIR